MADQSSYMEVAKIMGAPGSKIRPPIIKKIADEKEIRILMGASIFSRQEE